MLNFLKCGQTYAFTAKEASVPLLFRGKGIKKVKHYPPQTLNYVNGTGEV